MNQILFFAQFQLTEMKKFSTTCAIHCCHMYCPFCVIWGYTGSLTYLCSINVSLPYPLSYDVCLEVKREYCQNCSVLGCATQCLQSAVHLHEHFLQVQQIGLVTLGPLCYA